MLVAKIEQTSNVFNKSNDQAGSCLLTLRCQLCTNKGRSTKFDFGQSFASPVVFLPPGRTLAVSFSFGAARDVPFRFVSIQSNSRTRWRCSLVRGRKTSGLSSLKVRIPPLKAIFRPYLTPYELLSGSVFHQK